MKRWMTPLATLAGIAVMLACASAQQTPAPAQGQDKTQGDKQAKKPPVDKKKASPDQAKKDDSKAKPDDSKPDATDDSEAKQLYNSLTLGYSSWNSSGNNAQMNQHGLVQGGFGIADLSILVPFEKARFYYLDLNGIPGDDFGLFTKAQWGGSTSVVVNAHQFTYFDPSFGTVDPSVQKAVDATIDQQLAPNFGAFVTMSSAQWQHNFPAPIASTNFTDKTVAVGVQKESGDHTFGATYTENSYSDQTGNQPSTLTDRGQLKYIGNFGPRFSAMGSIGLTRIEQQGMPDNWIRDYALSGIYDVNDNAAIGAHVGEQDLDLNGIQSAYVQRKVDSGITYNTRLGSWGLGLGYGHREEERVRADHSYVDVPEWNTYTLKLNGKLLHSYRLGVNGSIDDLSSAPVFLTDDPTLLYWSRKAKVTTKLSAGSETTSEYFSYTYRENENSMRQFSITENSVAVGGSRVFNSKLLGYAEFASDQYNSAGENALASQLGSYFGSDETFMFGLDYTRNSREGLSLVMTSFYTEDEWGQQIALTYRLDLGKDRNFLITYSPWLQRDRLYDVDTFTAPILTAKIGFRF